MLAPNVWMSVDPGVTDDEPRTVTDGIFERVQASGDEVVQESMVQDYGVRDCALRDPAGNFVRIQERR